MASADLIWCPASASLISICSNGKQRVDWSFRGGGNSFRFNQGRAAARSGQRRTGNVEASSRLNRVKKQPFVEPQWLLPNNDGEDLPATSERNKVEESTSGRPWSSSQFQDLAESTALYYIAISTAKDEKSGLSEPSAGILLSLIGENGNAFMLPRSSEDSGEGQGISMPEGSLRFQRGAADFITVVGPNLGRLAALWIAPKAGTWRVEKVTVAILPFVGDLAHDATPCRDMKSLLISETLKESANTGEWKGLVHLFGSNEALLGDDAWLAAAELKPSLIEETSDPVELQEKLLKLSPNPPRSSQGLAKLQKEGMLEYQNLKHSLLSLSALLVVGGAASLAALGQGKLAEGFSVGGVGGFLYLLLLQRAVDQLPGSTTADFSEEKDDMSMYTSIDDKTRTVAEGNETGAQKGESTVNLDISRSDIGLRGRIALVVGVALLVGRLAQGGAVSALSPPELLAGLVGFLTSKVAVVLAILKPTSSTRDD